MSTDNNIGDKGIQTIIELLMTNTMLTSLNLSRDCDSYLNRIVRFDLKKNDKQ